MSKWMAGFCGVGIMLVWYAYQKHSKCPPELIDIIHDSLLEWQQTSKGFQTIPNNPLLHQAVRKQKISAGDHLLKAFGHVSGKNANLNTLPTSNPDVQVSFGPQLINTR
jgi:hypothetical protein